MNYEFLPEADNGMSKENKGQELKWKNYEETY